MNLGYPTKVIIEREVSRWSILEMDQNKKKSRKTTRKLTNVSLHDFEALAKKYGYIEEGGKHPNIIIGNHTLPYKRENPVKACYVKELYDIIEQL